MKSNVVNFARDGKFYHGLGLKLVKAKRFLEASENFKKAIELDPNNALYHFNLAGVFAELGNIEECISVLKNAVLKIDVFPEFYFALGCNYFNMVNYRDAKENFEQYLSLDPEGQYATEAKDGVNFINDYIFKTENGLVSRQVNKMIAQADDELAKQNFNTAIKLLKDAIKLDPKSLRAYNNLSIIYYMLDRVDMAIDTARKVLKLDSNDPYANVNLALYYKHIGNEDFYQMQLYKLLQIKYNNKEDIINVVGIISKLDEKGYLVHFLDTVTAQHDDAILIHFKAMAYHNVCQFDEAERIWKTLRDREQYLCIFIDCFLNKNNNDSELTLMTNFMTFDSKTFEDYVIRVEGLIKSLIECNFAEFKATWENNPYIPEIVNYCLYKLKTKERLKLLSKLQDIEDEESVDILQTYVKNCIINDQVKRECENILRHKKVVGDNIVIFKKNI